MEVWSSLVYGTCLENKQPERVRGFKSYYFRQVLMESNAAGLVLRRALKTRFSEMGWGSTPLLSAKFCYSGRSVRRGGIEQCDPHRESDLVSEVCDKS